MRKTKIIGTIGPSSMDYAVLKGLVQAGLNVVRINLSHATRQNMNDILANVKRVREELNCRLPIMLDTKGPEIRVKSFKTGKINIKKGQLFTFTGRDIVGDETIVSFNEPKIVEITNKVLGRGKKFTECDVSQVELMDLVVSELKTLK